MSTSVMPFNRLSNAELVRHVDNLGEPTPLEKELAERLAVLQREKEIRDSINRPRPNY